MNSRPDEPDAFVFISPERSTLDRYGYRFPKLDETLTNRLDDLHRSATKQAAPPADRTEDS